MESTPEIPIRFEVSQEDVLTYLQKRKIYTIFSCDKYTLIYKTYMV